MLWAAFLITTLSASAYRGPTIKVEPHHKIAVRQGPVSPTLSSPRLRDPDDLDLMAKDANYPGGCIHAHRKAVKEKKLKEREAPNQSK